MRGACLRPPTPYCGNCSLDLLHADFTSIETTLELNQSPRVANILMFQDHFMKDVLAYVSPDQTAKTITKVPVSGLHFNIWSPSQAPE